MPFRVVQPYGEDKARESTIINEHATAAEAFVEIDRLSSEMVRTGAPYQVSVLLSINRSVGRLTSTLRAWWRAGRRGEQAWRRRRGWAPVRDGEFAARFRELWKVTP